MQTLTQNKPTQPIIVAALDLMIRSEEILRTAAQLAATAGELHVIHVIPREAGASSEGKPLHLVHQADQVRSKLTLMAAELPTSIKQIVLHVRTGSPDVEISQLASDVAADLVVVGTQDHTGIERLILGSVGASLIRNAPCPVLVCRPKSIARWEQILPPCADCRAVQQSTDRKSLWCERHSQHHPRAHTYSEIPTTFGIGTQTFR